MQTTSAIGETVTLFQGGVDSITGEGAAYQITFGGTWLVAEEFSTIFTDSLSGLQTLVGAGNVTEFVPSFVFTFNNKVYAMGGTSTASTFIPGTIFFSALNAPTIWNDPNASGNGFVSLSNWYGTPETMLAAATFQGYLAFFSRWNIQIWQVDANPNNWQLIQHLPNAGAIAPLSVQSLGQLDVLFLSDTGIRSLRVRDYSLTGFISDIGSPIDGFILASLITGTATSNANACSIVDPTTGRYWCYLNGTIYVLSYFPSNKIVAWSTYTPVDSNGNAFTVQQLVVFQGQVWAYGQDSLGNTCAWQYGGSNNDTYDSTVVTVQTPFYDSKAPGIEKQSEGFDLALNSEFPSLVDANNAAYALWTASFSMDPLLAPTVFTQFYVGTADNPSSTYDIDAITASDSGSHATVKLVTSGPGPATLSAITWHYRVGAETTD